MTDSDVAADVGFSTPRGRRISLKVCLGWAVGSIGTVALLSTVNALALKYVVDNLGMTAALAGAIITATRLFDASLDPFMGMISDRTRHKWGRRRPYLLLGAILCAVAPLLLFSDPFSIAQLQPTLYVIAALMFFSVAYTVFNVPYITMSYELASAPKDRTLLMSIRVYCMSAGAILGASLGPWIVTRFGGGMPGFAAMGYVLCAVITITCLSSFLFTKDARVVEVSKTAPRPKFRDAIKTFQNRPFVCLIFAKSAYLFGAGIGGATFAFFVTQVLDKDLTLLGVVGVTIMICVIASQPVWVYLAGRLGKRWCFIVSAPLSALANLSWLLASSGDPLWTAVVRAILVGLAAGGMTLAIQAMLPDTMQHEAERTDAPQEGVMAGVFTTIERGVSALGVGVAGLILSVGGYVSSVENMSQSENAVSAIYLCVAIIPALSILVSIGFIWKYDLKG